MFFQKNSIIFIKSKAGSSWLIRISEDTHLEDGKMIPADFCLYLLGNQNTYRNSKVWGAFNSKLYTARDATLEEMKFFYTKFPELSRSCNHNYEAY